MSGPFTEDPRRPEADPEWVARYEAKMAELMAAREERIRSRTEGVAGWQEVEQRVDEALAERARRRDDS